jgi:hypothetical protein
MFFLVPALFSQNLGGSSASVLKTDGAEFGRLFSIPDFEKPVPVPLADSVSGNSATGNLVTNNSPANTPSPSYWLKDLRRAEIVAFGSLPLTIFWTSFVMDMYRYSTHNWNQAYAPWPLKGAGAVGMDYNEIRTMFTIAIGSSLVIALVDHIIVRIKRTKAQKAEAASAPVIKREPENGADVEN